MNAESIKLFLANARRSPETVVCPYCNNPERCAAVSVDDQENWIAACMKSDRLYRINVINWEPSLIKNEDDYERVYNKLKDEEDLSEVIKNYLNSKQE